ncbi:MAG: hypothetical protein EU532_14860 [Promethearchaeota archaeon]|nr:MAG: hypothetical protein EU532_14860 [Candidatus Lokiarchaeota archaeon]
MNVKIIENLPKNKKETEINSQVVENSKWIKEGKIEFKCAFYDKCSLPKNDSLCNQFRAFMICPDYITKRNKIINEK